MSAPSPSFVSRAAAALVVLAALALPAVARGQAGVSYLIPPDNPLAGTAGARPEIFAMGLRNPYRFSFDRANGDLLIGDVGGSAWEEIDWSTLAGARGANFGWPCREGLGAGPGGGRCPAPAAVEPLFNYATPTGAAVIGGYVVRDPSLTGLVGRYLYADHANGEIRSLALSFGAPNDQPTGVTLPTGGLSSFGEDASGRLYVTDLDGGVVYRLVSSGGSLATAAVPGSYSAPTYVTAPRGDASRLFVVEQGGRIRLVKDGVALATPFLDIEGLVLSGGEQGLLSMAFAPDYATSGRFYVYFTDNAGDIRVDEFRRSADPDRADPATRRLVLAIPHPGEDNHNGGQLQFGPDGYLYAGTGDGGGQGDVHDNAQNRARLLGKLLRIDPDMAPGAGPLQPARDITPPRLRTRVPARQRVLRLGGVVAYARCGERCRLSVGAVLRTRGRSYRLRQASRTVGRGRLARVKVRLTRRSRRALRTALRRGRRPAVRIGLRARDPAGNASRLVRRRVGVRR